MKYYNLTDTEARNWRQINTILVVLKEQPPNLWKLSRIGNDFVEFYNPATEPTLSQPDIETEWDIWKLPYAVGDVVGCRETWAYDLDEGYVYLSDDMTENVPHGFNYWHSPDKDMPIEAIRRWWKVLGVDVKRVQKITAEEWTKTGNGKNVSLKEFFNKYARPIRRRDGYIHYLYDNTPESRTYITEIPGFRKYHRNLDIKTGDKLGYYDTWKGKPLWIIANPYIASYEVKRINKSK